MRLTVNHHNVGAMRVFRVTACLALLATAAYPQAEQNRPSAISREQLAEAMNQLEQGDFFPAHLEWIAEARAVQAVPELKNSFC